MKHASHKATKVSRQQFSLAKVFFASGKGSHRARAVRAMQAAGSDAAVLGLDPAVAEKINEIAPQTRRSIRQAARAAIFLLLPLWQLWPALPPLQWLLPTLKRIPRCLPMRPLRLRRLSASPM